LSAARQFLLVGLWLLPCDPVVCVLVTDYGFADLDQARIDQLLQGLALIWIGPTIEDKG